MGPIKNYLFKLIGIMCIYAAHTMPLYFATLAVPTILRAQGAPLPTIGLLGFLMLPWAFRFLCGPFLDRCYQHHFGKRKSWIMSTQFLIIALTSSLLFISPIHHSSILFLILFSMSFFSAIQDVASAAFVIEQLLPEKRQWGNFAQVLGTTLGSACGGALILYCYGHYGWHAAVLLLFGFCVLLFFVLIIIREDIQTTLRQREMPSFKSFWTRMNTRHLLYMCLIYRGCEGLIMGMQQPFLVDEHIQIETIGLIMGAGNLTLGLFAAGTASILFQALGNWRMLMLLGVLRSISYFGLFVIAVIPIKITFFIFSIVLMNMATRLMEMVVLYTIFMDQCSSHQAATDFSILVCGELLIYMLGMMLSGYLAQHLGYAGLFFLGTLLSLPSMIISTKILIRINQKLQASLGPSLQQFPLSVGPS